MWSLITVFLSSDFQYEYFNAVLINEVDELGNSVELGGEFILQPNDHFNNLSVNLSLSVVQVPTNMYNKGMFVRLIYDEHVKIQACSKCYHHIVYPALIFCRTIQ